MATRFSSLIRIGERRARADDGVCEGTVSNRPRDLEAARLPMQRFRVRFDNFGQFIRMATLEKGKRQKDVPHAIRVDGTTIVNF